MPLLRRPLRCAVLLLLGCLLTLAWAPNATAATAASPVAQQQAPMRGHVRLHGDAGTPVAAGRTSARTSARHGSLTWRGSRISYYETIPAKWDWSLSRAVATWNGAGATIRFVRTTDRRRAQLTIGYGNTDGAAGLATVGRTRHATVRLAPSYDRVDALDAHNRVEVLGIFAHELGHVLGFSHTSARCSLMSPVLDVSGCGVVSDAHPGYYGCRTLDTPLLARFVRTYGGRARHVTTPWCLIDPLPSALSVAFRGGGTGPVAVSWRRPTYLPSGSRVQIQHWSADTCAAAPAWSTTAYVAPTAGLWSDSTPEDALDNCFSARLVNRYGAGRATVRATLVRLAPEAVALAPSTDPAGEIAPVP